MKDLFISMGDDISVRNFVPGPLTYSRLTASDIAPLVDETRKAGRNIRAYFDFGAVPSEKKQRTFKELVTAFAEATGVQLTAADFTMDLEDGDEALPHFNFIPTVTDDTRMLAVEYFFEQSEGVEDFLEGFKVSHSNMDFHLFEKAG